MIKKVIVITKEGQGSKRVDTVEVLGKKPRSLRAEPTVDSTPEPTKPMKVIRPGFQNNNIKEKTEKRIGLRERKIR